MAAELGVALACTTGPDTHPMSAGKAVLALLRGEEPEAVEPHYRLVSALEAVTGEYVSYRNIMQASVERVGGGLRFEMAGAGGEQEHLLVPEHVADGRLVCTTTTGAGMERSVRFERDDEGNELFYERHRFTGPS